MSTNRLEKFAVCHIDNLRIPSKELSLYARMFFDEGTVFYRFAGGCEVDGMLDSDRILSVTRIDWNNNNLLIGELLPVLKQSTGEMTAVCRWDNGNSEQLIVKDGSISWQKL